ncbi:MAG: hypothetical protein CMK09_17485 [Ponticaulis sp.]|nr:hypothetical protein [Ponticaulis sp.]
MKSLIALTGALCASASLTLPVAAESWSKSWVIDYYEFAHIYGREDASDALRGNGGHSAGAIHETVSHINLPVWWHALKNHADGLPDPETGQNMGISTVYRIWAKPAFVSTPDGRAPVTKARSFVPVELAEAATSDGEENLDR